MLSILFSPSCVATENSKEKALSFLIKYWEMGSYTLK